MLTLRDRATNEIEDWMAKAGVPFPYWRHELSELPFRRCAHGVGKKPETLTPDTQRRALQQLVVQPRQQLVVLGSTPTDRGALAAAGWVTKELFAAQHHVIWANADTTDKQISTRASAVVMYNVLQEATPARTEAVRDLICRWSWVVRIVVVAGCTDPYAFCCSRLGLRPDFCGRVEDPR